jgi:multiple sugar transport system substrate-binding protein
MYGERAGDRCSVVANKVVSRGKFLKLGGAGLVGTALLGVAGCGGGGQQGKGPVELNVTYSPVDDTSGAMTSLLKDFNRQNKGKIQVNGRAMSADNTEYFSQLRTQFQAGKGPDVIASGDVIWPAELAANGWIADLSDRFPEDEQQKFLDGPIEANTWDGKIWGVPHLTEAGMLYYRKDLLEQSGFDSPPKTWGELKEMTEKVMTDSGNENGFVFQGAEYEGGVCNGLEYIWTHGGNILDSEDSSQVVVDSPESAAGLSTERSMVADGITPQAVSTYTEQESASAFLRGEAVFIRNWSYLYALLSDESASKVRPEQVGIALLPTASEGQQSTSSTGGGNFFIGANAKDQDAAWEFVKFMSAPEQLKFFAIDATRLPPLKGLYDDPEVVAEVPVVGLAEGVLKRARPRPVSPYYFDMSLAMAEQFNTSLKGNTPPEEAVATLQDSLQQIVEQAQ